MSDDIRSKITGSVSAMNETSSDDSDDSSGDYETRAVARVSPLAVVAGEVIDVFYTGRTNDSAEDQQGKDFGFVVENPEVVLGTIFRNEAKDDSPTGLMGDSDEGGQDYKVIDPQDPDTTLKEDKGVVEAPNSGAMFGEVVDEFEEDVVTLFFGGSVASRNIARALDVNGDVGAYVNEDGVDSQGLVEYHPDWYEDRDEDTPVPRIANYPQLREDVEGETVAILLARRSDIDENYDGNMYWSNVFVVDPDEDIEDQLDADHKLEPTTGERTYDGERTESFLMYHDRGTTDEGSIDDEKDFSETEVAFIEDTAQRLEDDGLSPEEVNIESLVQDNDELDDSKASEIALEVENRVEA